MVWTPNPELRRRTPQPGWFPDTPEIEPRTPNLGWLAVFTRLGIDSGAGEGGAFTSPKQDLLDSGIGSDYSVVSQIELVSGDSGAGLGAGLNSPAQAVWDSGLGEGLGRSGVRGTDSGIGADYASDRPRVFAPDSGLGDDMCWNSASGLVLVDSGLGSDLVSALKTTVPTPVISGAGSDSGSGGFTYQAPTAVQSITTTGTHQYIDIPVWCRYIDVVLLGGGGGGAGGSQLGADGKGGAAGVYASRRWDRDVSRNNWRQLAILLGNGGSGGSRNNNGSGGSGGKTELWIDDWSGWVGEYLSANGGSGGSGTNPPLGNEVPGKSPGNHNFQGIAAVGGGGNSAVPGSGGEGGGGSTWPLTSGSGKAGARGQAWIQFSM